MLVCDMRTMQALFYPLEDGAFREVRVISMAETHATIGGDPRKLSSTWKRYSSRHREEHLARQKHSRATHRDQVRTYTHQYEQSRKMQKGASPGVAGTFREVALCSP